MGKGKKASDVLHRPLYSRASFLYQAALLLASPQPLGNQAISGDGQQHGEAASHPLAQKQGQHQLDGMSRLLLTDLRTVTQKTQIRLSPDMKRTICKFCDTILIEGKTCTSTVQNSSRGGRKPWADVLVIKCRTCDKVKRFPVNPPRQPRKTARPKMSEAEPPTEQDVDTAHAP